MSALNEVICVSEENKLEIVVDKDLRGVIHINGVKQEDVARAYILCEPQHYTVEIEYNDRKNGAFHTKYNEIVKITQRFEFCR